MKTTAKPYFMMYEKCNKKSLLTKRRERKKRTFLILMIGGQFVICQAGDLYRVLRNLGIVGNVKCVFFLANTADCRKTCIIIMCCGGAHQMYAYPGIAPAIWN